MILMVRDNLGKGSPIWRQSLSTEETRLGSKWDSLASSPLLLQSSQPLRQLLGGSLFRVIRVPIRILGRTGGAARENFLILVNLFDQLVLDILSELNILHQSKKERFRSNLFHNGEGILLPVVDDVGILDIQERQEGESHGENLLSSLLGLISERQSFQVDSPYPQRISHQRFKDRKTPSERFLCLRGLN